MRNRLFKKTFALAFACLAAFSAFGCGGSAAVKPAPSYETLPVYKYTYGMLKDYEMPVVTFGGPIHGYVKDGYKPETMISDGVFRAYKEAGVNGVVGTANWVNGDNTAEVEAILGFADKYGINYTTFDTSLVHCGNGYIASLDSPAVKERLAFYEKHKSFAGIYCQDEPRYQQIDTLAQAVKFVSDYNEQSGKNIIGYSNMHPYWSNNGYYSTDMTDKSCNYEKLVRMFLDEVKLPYLSYDKYPIFGSGEDETAIVDQEWFMNMALIRGWAQEYEIPFWVCLQTGSVYSDRAPNESEFMWMLNSALACGAKGIEYFPGAHPMDGSDGMYENMDMGNLGIVELDGQKTQYYYYSQKANVQLKAVQKYLMNAASVGIMANAGNSPDANINNDFIYEMPEGYTFLLDDFRELKSASSNALVGCFDYKGKTLLYAINNSIKAETREITLEFDDNYAYGVIQRGAVRSASGKKLTLKLNGGEGALILLK